MAVGQVSDNNIRRRFLHEFADFMVKECRQAGGAAAIRLILQLTLLS